MPESRRTIQTAPERIGRRLVGGLLVAVALLASPVAQALALHHADHHGHWIGAEPDGTQAGAPATGHASESSCLFCLASGQSGSLAPADASAPPAPDGASSSPGLRPTPRPPGAGDRTVAGPRAPPCA